MEHRRIIKRGPVVLATHEDGSMDPSSAASQGLFLADTRYLSTFKICLNGQDLILMGSSEEILFQASFIFTNPAISAQDGDDDACTIPARGLGILQHNSIDEDAVKIEVAIVNWALKPVRFGLSIELDSDFFDSFEARGVHRLKRGEVKTPEITDTCLDFEYVGLDNVTRVTRISIDPHFERWDGNRAHWEIDLENGERKTLVLSIGIHEEVPADATGQPEPQIDRSATPEWFEHCSRVSTGNNSVDAIIRRNIDDLAVLFTEFEDAWMPCAGLPRFAVPFGRDSLYTGLQTLMWNPLISRDVLRFLAHRQGKEENPWNYEQPGKIMHEMHTGELARLKEVPFGLFYGSVDSTVLFLVLGAEYIRWTGDVDLFRELKPNFEAAWKWIDDYGDIDGTGYVQYKAHTPPKVSSDALTVGLFNQGWKDSATAVMYSNGEMVTDHPVSLAEVQGDLYRALHSWAGLYKAMPQSEGMHDEGVRLESRAAKLKEQFNREFWMPQKGFYAMALDGHHRQVDSITSNPLQCLWARLIDEDNVESVARVAMSDEMLTSWGIRTMASNEKAYNPFSYHDGSVWPFENALIASGMKKYGLLLETQRIFDAMVDASLYFEYRRWPEVYAGVTKAVGGVLARQPDACRPQAWSAGAIFMLMQTILGIATKPFSSRVDITPALPACIDEVVVENMSIAGGKLSLRVVREHDAVLLEIRDNPDDLDVIVHPPVRNHRHETAKGGPAVSR